MTTIHADRTYKASCIRWGIWETNSGAKAITLDWRPFEILNDDWSWSPIETEEIIEGDVWIIRRGGDLSEFGMNTAVNVLGWSGVWDDLDMSLDHEWRPNDCIIKTELDESTGKIRVSFHNSLTAKKYKGGERISDAFRERLKRQYENRTKAFARGDYRPPPAPPKTGGEKPKQGGLQDGPVPF